MDDFILYGSIILGIIVFIGLVYMLTKSDKIIDPVHKIEEDNFDSSIIPSGEGQKTSEMNLNPFISCECDALQTWHPDRVKHKMNCRKFWSLNPNRTKKELLKFEGFLQEKCASQDPPDNHYELLRFFANNCTGQDVLDE